MRFFRASIALILFATVALFAAACGSDTTPSTTGPATVVLSAPTLGFLTQSIGAASPTQPLTVTNSGGVALGITSITVSGDFSISNPCGSTLAGGANCSLTVTFTPTAVGTRTGAITITDNAANSPQVIPLSGNGGSAQVTLQPASLGFSSQVVGVLYGTTGTRTLTVVNGGSTVNISSIATTGDFAQANTCGTSIIAGNNCTVTVTFLASSTGGRSGTLVINDDAPGSPHTAILTGVGLSPAAVPVFLQNPLTFPGQAVGSTSKPSSVQLANQGASTLNISGISTSGEFAQTNSCGATLAPNANCVINVTFSPAGPGTRAGTLNVTDDAPGGVQKMSISGIGTDSSTGARVTFAPAGLTFASQSTGATSAAQSVTVTNSGAATLAISSIGASGDFSQTNTCGASLAAGGSCAIAVRFSPTAAGTRTGAVTIVDSASGSPQTVLLTGTGVAAVAIVTLSPANIGFGTQVIGTPSSVVTGSIINSGAATLNISSLSTSGDFSETDNCRRALAPGASCAVNVTFTPSAVGTRTGAIVIADDAPTAPQTISLSGTGGLGEAITLGPGNLAFGTFSVGTASDTQTVTFTNSGALSVAVKSVAISGDFAQTNTCVGTIAAGASCTVSVTFTPTATGTRVGSLTFVDDAPGSPHAVVLTGSGS